MTNLIDWNKVGLDRLIDKFVDFRIKQNTYPKVLEVGSLEYTNLIEFLTNKQVLTDPPRLCDAQIIKSTRFEYGYKYL